MDDKFLSKTSLELIGVNETFNCVLGVDTALKVSYGTESRTVQETARFAEPTKTTTRTITTTVKNGHQFDITGLIIRDTVPLGDDDAHIGVVLRKPHGLVQATSGEVVTVKLGGSEVQEANVRWTKVENGEGGEKDGMYEWVCAIPAGKKVELEAEWEIKAPSNVDWKEGTNTPGSDAE